MTQPVVTVHEDCPAVLAFRKMHEHQIRRLPVIDEDGALVGIVADRDLRGVALAALNGRAPSNTAEEIVSDYMVRDVVTCAPGDDVRDAALTMLSKRFTGLPVMDHGRLVGMITVTDLMEILVGALEKQDRAQA
jgi:acetoin utilization protein AcuB